MQFLVFFNGTNQAANRLHKKSQPAPRLNYRPKDYINTLGGDPVVDVSASSGEVDQVVWGSNRRVMFPASS